MYRYVPCVRHLRCCLVQESSLCNNPRRQSHIRYTKPLSNLPRPNSKVPNGSQLTPVSHSRLCLPSLLARASTEGFESLHKGPLCVELSCAHSVSVSCLPALAVPVVFPCCCRQGWALQGVTSPCRKLLPPGWDITNSACCVNAKLM